MNRRLEERRAQHKRYKEDVESRGKPFYPFAMFHDTVQSLVVVSVIVGLAVIWKVTAEEGPTEEDSGLLGKLYDEPADPGTTNFIPRPDWYFYFLFYLLRIFKWPDSVILGTVGIPTIAIMLLIALPFIDVKRERRLSRRPVAIVAAILTVLSMGVLTYKGATAEESLGADQAVIDEWAQEQGFEDNEQAMEGARIFAVVGCGQCHTYQGFGTTNEGAPDLSEIGNSGRDAEAFAEYIANPSEFGNDVMPRYAGLGEERLLALGEFLAASKGGE
jgi:menaquinol-cytochrome c reductase cytochrome b/c subunit